MTHVLYSCKVSLWFSCCSSPQLHGWPVVLLLLVTSQLAGLRPDWPACALPLRPLTRLHSSAGSP